MQVSNIICYPIKSCGGIQLNEAQLGRKGLLYGMSCCNNFSIGQLIYYLGRSRVVDRKRREWRLRYCQKLSKVTHYQIVILAK